LRALGWGLAAGHPQAGGRTARPSRKRQVCHRSLGPRSPNPAAIVTTVAHRRPCRVAGRTHAARGPHSARHAEDRTRRPRYLRAHTRARIARPKRGGHRAETESQAACALAIGYRAASTRHDRQSPWIEFEDRAGGPSPRAGAIGAGKTRLAIESWRIATQPQPAPEQCA